MSKFTVEFKEAILTKLLDGDYASITTLAEHYNISKSTLYNSYLMNVISSSSFFNLYYSLY